MKAREAQLFSKRGIGINIELPSAGIGNIIRTTRREKDLRLSMVNLLAISDAEVFEGVK